MHFVFVLTLSHLNVTDLSFLPWSNWMFNDSVLHMSDIAYTNFITIGPESKPNMISKITVYYSKFEATCLHDNLEYSTLPSSGKRNIPSYTFFYIQYLYPLAWELNHFWISMLVNTLNVNFNSSPCCKVPHRKISVKLWKLRLFSFRVFTWKKKLWMFLTEWFLFVHQPERFDNIWIEVQNQMKVNQMKVKVQKSNWKI